MLFYRSLAFNSFGQLKGYFKVGGDHLAQLKGLMEEGRVIQQEITAVWFASIWII